MTPFKLKIVTPDGLIFDGEAEKLIVRTNAGDVAILDFLSKTVLSLPHALRKDQSEPYRVGLFVFTEKASAILSPHA